TPAACAAAPAACAAATPTAATTAAASEDVHGARQHHQPSSEHCEPVCLHDVLPRISCSCSSALPRSVGPLKSEPTPRSDIYPALLAVLRTTLTSSMLGR